MADYFIGASESEKLRAELKGLIPVGGTKPPAKDAVRERVNSAQQWGAMQKLAQRAIGEGRDYRANVASKRETYKPAAFQEWIANARESYAAQLRELNNEFSKLDSSIADAFPATARPAPVTSVDAINLNTRLRVLDSATPADASALVSDAIQRGDRPFLDAAGVLLRSWPASRNSWKGPEPAGVARKLVEDIETASVSAEDIAGTIASQQAAVYRANWRYAVNVLLDNEGVLDPVHIEQGALGPLLAPAASS